MAFNFVVKKKKSVYQIIITRSKLKHFIVEGKKCVNETGERETKRWKCHAKCLMLWWIWLKCNRIKEKKKHNGEQNCMFLIFFILCLLQYLIKAGQWFGKTACVSCVDWLLFPVVCVCVCAPLLTAQNGEKFWTREMLHLHFALRHFEMQPASDFYPGYSCWLLYTSTHTTTHTSSHTYKYTLIHIHIDTLTHIHKGGWGQTWLWSTTVLSPDRI